MFLSFSKKDIQHMNGKLFLFGIGGTGSRVIKSLVMMAASGVDIDARAIVPIIIDPDFANADLTRTIESIKRYSAVRSSLDFTAAYKNQFFKTDFQDILNGYRFKLKDTKNKKFREFIQYDTLSKENRAFASMLFSKSNLDSDMEVGFRGNPNIGSVVLNQFTDSEDFEAFASAFRPGDRIFIVSSIFGGTGASGFPLILKNIRSILSTMPNCEAIKNAPVGAITVLPYFAVKPDANGAINSSTFIGKTKAALHYYEKNVTGDNSSVNVLYYIGDDKTKQYENEEGGTTQRNNAHIVEFASALSIIDFVSISDTDSSMECDTDNNGRVFAPTPRFKEFGIENDKDRVVFTDLSRKTKDIVCAPLTQFALTSKYMDEHLHSALSLPWAKDNGINETFLKSSFATEFRKITESYIGWLKEMDDNDRGFKPFNIDISKDHLFSIVENVKPTKVKGLIGFLKSGYDLFDAFLDNKHTSLPKSSVPQKFTELFYVVTKELVSKKYKF